VAGKPAVQAGALVHTCPENWRIQKYAVRARSPVTVLEFRESQLLATNDLSLVSKNLLFFSGVPSGP